MKRKRLEFTMEHTLVRRTVRNLRIIKEVVDTVQLQVVGYLDPNSGPLEGERYSCDIEAIWWEGRDLFPLLEAVGALERFEEAALRETVHRFMAPTTA